MSNRTCAILTMMAGAVFGAWWWTSQRESRSTARRIPARDRSMVIFDNHATAIEAEGIVLLDPAQAMVAFWLALRSRVSTTRANSCHYCPGWVTGLWLSLGILTLLLGGGCKPGVPVVDVGPKPPAARGTLTGTVRGPEGTSPIGGRTVEIFNTVTGEKYSTTTSDTGGFTVQLPAGKYRARASAQGRRDDRQASRRHRPGPRRHRFARRIRARNVPGQPLPWSRISPGQWPGLADSPPSPGLRRGKLCLTSDLQPPTSDPLHCKR